MSWARTAPASSSASAAARRAILPLMSLDSLLTNGDAARRLRARRNGRARKGSLYDDGDGDSLLLLAVAVGAERPVRRARERILEVREGGVELADVVERAVSERQGARGRVGRGAIEAGEGDAEDAHGGAERDVPRVVAGTAAVREAGVVAAQDAEVALRGGRGRGDRGVEPH